jgi:hypothetical protein
VLLKELETLVWVLSRNIVSHLVVVLGKRPIERCSEV